MALGATIACCAGDKTQALSLVMAPLLIALPQHQSLKRDLGRMYRQVFKQHAPSNQLVPFGAGDITTMGSSATQPQRNAMFQHSSLVAILGQFHLKTDLRPVCRNIFDNSSNFDHRNFSLADFVKVTVSNHPTTTAPDACGLSPVMKGVNFRNGIFLIERTLKDEHVLRTFAYQNNSKLSRAKASRKICSNARLYFCELSHYARSVQPRYQRTTSAPRNSRSVVALINSRHVSTPRLQR